MLNVPKLYYNEDFSIGIHNQKNICLLIFIISKTWNFQIYVTDYLNVHFILNWVQLLHTHHKYYQKIFFLNIQITIQNHDSNFAYILNWSVIDNFIIDASDET